MTHRCYLALDLEMNQPSRRIIQVGVAVGAPGCVPAEIVTREWLLDPEEPIAPNIEALTGISDWDIQERAVSWGQVAEELGALIHEHQCFVNPVTWGGGDSELLLAAFRERGIHFPFFGRRWLDVKTWHVCQSLATGKRHAGGLASVMGGYKLPFIGKAHRADVDALNTLRLFFLLADRHLSFCEVVRLSRGIKD